MLCLPCLLCCALSFLQYVGPELDDPSSSECMQFMQRVGRENWKAFANKKPQVRPGSMHWSSEPCTLAQQHPVDCMQFCEAIGEQHVYLCNYRLAAEQLS